MSTTPADQPLPTRAARQIGLLATLYALALALLERRLPIKPTWVALEVIGGVLLVGLPVMRLAREARSGGAELPWQGYEQMVAAGFAAAGAPILLWQALEYALHARRGSSGEVR